MRSRILFTILPALLVFSARPVAAQSCEMLSSLKLPDATITMAQSVAAGAFTPPQGGGRGGGAQAITGLRHQGRSLASLFRMERQVPGNRQRRMERQYRRKRARRWYPP